MVHVPVFVFWVKVFRLLAGDQKGNTGNECVNKNDYQ